MPKTPTRTCLTKFTSMEESSLPMWIARPQLVATSAVDDDRDFSFQTTLGQYMMLKNVSFEACRAFCSRHTFVAKRVSRSHVWRLSLAS